MRPGVQLHFVISVKVCGRHLPLRDIYLTRLEEKLKKGPGFNLCLSISRRRSAVIPVLLLATSRTSLKKKQFWAHSVDLTLYLTNVSLPIPPLPMIALQNCAAREKVGLGSAFLSCPGAVYQPVQGFDYAKQHLGQQGGDEETLPASQDTLMMSLQIRDTPLALEKALQQDGTGNRKSLTSDKHKRYRHVYTRPRFLVALTRRCL